MGSHTGTVLPQLSLEPGHASYVLDYSVQWTSLHHSSPQVAAEQRSLGRQVHGQSSHVPVESHEFKRQLNQVRQLDKPPFPVKLDSSVARTRPMWCAWISPSAEEGHSGRPPAREAQNLDRHWGKEKEKKSKKSKRKKTIKYSCMYSVPAVLIICKMNVRQPRSDPQLHPDLFLPLPLDPGLLPQFVLWWNSTSEFGFVISAGAARVPTC